MCMMSLLRRKSSKEMKQFIHVTLKAHNKIKSKLSISNEPPFLVKHKALLSSRGTDNILTLKGNNDKREKKRGWFYDITISHDMKTLNIF